MESNPNKNPGGSNDRTSRRRFLQAAIVGVAGATLVSTLGPREAQAAGHAEALLLTCMDYRLEDKTERYMARRGLRNKFDHIVLAGAALGALTDKYPEWNKTFWEELELSIDLHHIKKVILLDHRDCGGYKQLLGEDFAQQPKKETEVHAVQLRKLRGLIVERYTQLEVEMLLMSLSGKVEKI